MMSFVSGLRPPAGHNGMTLAELVVGMGVSSLIMIIVFMLYSQTQRVWMLGQTQITVDTDARRVLTQLTRQAVMAKAIAAYTAYPYGYVNVQNGYYASTYGYVVPSAQPSSFGYTVAPQGYKGLPYPSPTPASGAVAATSSDVLYLAVPHTAPSPSCSSQNDLYYYYADPDVPTQLKQTIYLCYTKSITPLPVTDSTLATNTGAQVLASSDYDSIKNSILTDKLDTSHGFSVQFPSQKEIDITLRVKQSGNVFGKTVSNTFTTRIYARNR